MPPFRRTTQKNSSLRPIDVQTSIAAVECANNHVYIFPTQDLSRDLCHHMQGSGSPFTVAHAPTGKVAVRMFVKDLENTTREMVAAYASCNYTVQNEFDLSADAILQVYRMRLQPVRLTVQTYVLETTALPNVSYNGRYVGKTQNLSLRLPHHWAGTGARWTRLHKPLTVANISMAGGDTAEEVSQHEDMVTLNLMQEYIDTYGEDGWRSVRGGRFTEAYMSHPPQALSSSLGNSTAPASKSASVVTDDASDGQRN
jgi:predicted GIY-YIG superfamily endonuclease